MSLRAVGGLTAAMGVAVAMGAAPAGAQSAAPSAAASVPTVTLPPALNRVLRDYEAAWRKGDAAALAALFADDGFVLQTGRAPVRGRAAITAAGRRPVVHLFRHGQQHTSAGLTRAVKRHYRLYQPAETLTWLI